VPRAAKPPVLKTTCCIAGGGPAGIMLGYMLARSGVKVTVLEKHADFLRDFRGDTVHPSTLEALYELGLLEDFLKRPHDEITELAGRIGDTVVKIADFRHLPTQAKFIALMPQWDFLDFLVQAGRRYPEFQVLMSAEAVDLTEADGRITGVKVKTADGPLTIEADLVVAADGRHSVLRDKAGLQVTDLGSPIDVLWMRLPRHADDPTQALGNLGPGYVFVMIPRGDYFQCGFVVQKGGCDLLRKKPLKAFRERIAQIVPFMADRVETLTRWDDIKLLTVTVDRLERWWKPGLLCIGDAAHAMSPIGGVGINLAVADAVAAANALAAPLAKRQLRDANLADVQYRRQRAVRLMQSLQLAIQDRVLSAALSSEKPIEVPALAKLLNSFEPLRRLPARVVGMGFRMEHVRTKDIHAR
jgi:2-polyprenyl-6-methoxyphenol hydroxylase-like FAD-dependent oxidoreductase